MKKPIPLVNIILLAVVLGGVFALLVSCAPAGYKLAAHQKSLISECRSWDAALRKATNPIDRRRLRGGARDCWRQVEDSAARAAALANRPIAIQMPHEAPAWQPSTPTFRAPDAPDPMPVPGVGAQKPQRGPVTWGETPFDVPPIMRDVPIEQFPWLAH